MKPVWDLPLDPSGIEVELDNGTHVRIRPGRPDDRDALMEAFERFSDTSRYNRFFSAKPRLSDALATSLSEIDDEHQLAWRCSTRSDRRRSVTAPDWPSPRPGCS